MTSNTLAPTQDQAWVSIETPFGAQHLKSFLCDIERLFRINSLMEFDEMRQIDDGVFSLKAKNLSNEANLELILHVAPDESGVSVVYSSGLKTITRFHIDIQPDGTGTLVITDDYGGASLEERQARIDEVDKSLVQWGRDIHRYLHQYKRWSWLPGWRWYMGRFWQSMKPAARRTSYMLIMITMAEFAFFLLIFAIFWLEFDQYLN